MTDPTGMGDGAALAPDVPITHPRHSTGRTTRATVLLAATALGAGMLVASPAAPTARAAAPAFCSDGSVPYAPVSQIRAWTGGEAVTGLTVSKGTTPEGFTGTYIGFIEGALGKGKDMLLFKLSSPLIDGTAGLKPAGVWQGMSGSPVYTSGGDLIGAVAYGFNSDNLPIAGITPAEYMKDIGKTGLDPASKVRLTSTSLKTTPAGAKAAGTPLAGKTLTQLGLAKFAGRAGTKANAFANRTLARTPKSVKASAVLRGKDFRPAAAQAASAVTQPLVPGGNLAVSYTSGDLVSAGVGTVTAICGNTVFGFGHPVNLEGKTSLFMSNASAAMVVPDETGWDGSYKEVSQFGAPLGMITQDRLMGIRGTIGAVTSVPVSVKVQNPAGKQIASYDIGAASQDVVGPALALVTGTAAAEQLDQYGAGTGKVNWTVNYRKSNGKTGKFSNAQVVSSAYYFPDEVATPPAEDVLSVTQQDFDNATVTGVGVTLKLLSDDALAYQVSKVQRLDKTKWKTLDGSKLKAGTSYSLRNVYQLFRNEKRAGTVTGPAYTATLSKSAKVNGKGKLKVFAFADDPSCDEDGCGDFSLPENPDVDDFDLFIALLDSRVSHDRVLGKLSYKLKKGSATRSYTWTGPGVMSGSTTASFTIAKK